MKKITGNIIDIHRRIIFGGVIHYSEGGIDRIEETGGKYDRYILPGLIDAHVHIESSMLVPSGFSRLVVPRGTIAVVTDPHEIGNVMGVEGVEYMIEESKNTPLKCFFGAPSCVPATPLESSGAVIDSAQIERLLEKPEIIALSEMMNFPGVVNKDPEVLAKIKAAVDRNLPVDGHAPGLRGEDLKQYAAAGIGTDHECFELSEALEKIKRGMKIQVRQGSAAKNFDALADLFKEHADDLMLCTDDSHPDELVKSGHIDKLIHLGLQAGIDLFKLLRAASLIPANHYNLPVGLLREGDPADFIVIDHPESFNVLGTYINGECVFDSEKGVLFSEKKVNPVNHFVPHFISENDLKIIVPSGKSRARVIQCFDGELVTDTVWTEVKEKSEMSASVDKDVLKIVVVDRYQNKPVSVGFINGFGLKQGALASSVAHDSHNVVAVGVNDGEIARAVNLVMEKRGGLVAVDGNEEKVLPLPVAGLMSNEDGRVVADKYNLLEKMAVQMGSTLKAPFMTLSFMSLLVIPKLKLGDKGLFDGEKFEFTSVFE
ncbi:adenine deaminase [Marinilabilia salmonicolor]|jgi:adenine deaminase|uniref:Adenine deaminase n=1 Tax=Marinilabilia salmonicolor TaxID=989 RepID=A0A2T0XSJ3_9BACT|nr:adenine deaminase [Marinilabilia salmonicolor]PRZ01908.1 adenine deaminase [Marinilabilia salmonicolor]RCW32014.1 adenine deaminase [Marinilabilia salmonicolor]